MRRQVKDVPLNSSTFFFFLTTVGSHSFPGSGKKDEVWTITYSPGSISQCCFNHQCHLSNQLPCRPPPHTHTSLILANYSANISPIAQLWYLRGGIDNWLQLTRFADVSFLCVLFCLWSSVPVFTSAVRRPAMQHRWCFMQDDSSTDVIWMVIQC